MLRQRLSERRSYSPYNSTPRSHNLKSDEKPIVSEWKLGLFGLLASLLVIAAKIYHANQEYIHATLIEKRLVSYEVFTEDGQLMFKYAWENAVKYSRFWLPLLCGLLTTYFTWIMVYLDSNVPGVQPPSPFSPKKYKLQSGHTFHLNYMFAIIVGILVFSYMYWKGVSIHY